MHFLWWATVAQNLHAWYPLWPGLAHLLCSCQASPLWAPTVVCLQKGRTADCAAETLSSASADAASPWEWIGPLSGSPSWCLENCRLDKKKGDRVRRHLLRAAFYRRPCTLLPFQHVPAAQLKGSLWPPFRFRPGVNDLTHRHSLWVWEERGERWSAFISGNSYHQFPSLYQAPLGDLVFTWKRQNAMEAACRLSNCTTTHSDSLRQLWMLLRKRGNVQWCTSPRVLSENDESSETPTRNQRNFAGT